MREHLGTHPPSFLPCLRARFDVLLAGDISAVSRVAREGALFDVASIASFEARGTRESLQRARHRHRRDRERGDPELLGADAAVLPSDAVDAEGVLPESVGELDRGLAGVARHLDVLEALRAVHVEEDVVDLARGVDVEARVDPAVPVDFVEHAHARVHALALIALVFGHVRAPGELAYLDTAHARLRVVQVRVRRECDRALARIHVHVRELLVHGLAVEVRWHGALVRVEADARVVERRRERVYLVSAADLGDRVVVAMVVVVVTGCIGSNGDRKLSHGSQGAKLCEEELHGG